VVERQPEVVIWEDPGDAGQSPSARNIEVPWGTDPGLSGRLRRQVLVLAAGVRWQEVRRWLDEGVGGVIAKPFLLTDLAWWIDYLARVGGGEEPFVPLVGTDLCPV
jgi:hypothetical protein